MEHYGINDFFVPEQGEYTWVILSVGRIYLESQVMDRWFLHKAVTGPSHWPRRLTHNPGTPAHSMTSMRALCGVCNYRKKAVHSHCSIPFYSSDPLYTVEWTEAGCGEWNYACFERQHTYQHAPPPATKSHYISDAFFSVWVSRRDAWHYLF